MHGKDFTSKYGHFALKFVKNRRYNNSNLNSQRMYYGKLNYVVHYWSLVIILYDRFCLSLSNKSIRHKLIGTKITMIDDAVVIFTTVIALRNLSKIFLSQNQRMISKVRIYIRSVNTHPSS